MHSLWQAMLVALLMAGAMILLQKRPARVRYVLANGSLLLVILLACYTFASIYYGGTDEKVSATLLGGTEVGVATENFQTSFWAIFETYFNEHMPLIVVIWLMGMVLFLLRMLGGLAYVEYLKNRFTREMPENWQLQLKQLINKLSLKREVRILESALVTVPMVIGWVKPVILIPVGAVNGLTADQAEAVLAHELAHISRHDFLINILQSIVEVLFYFNPAIWWISAVIRSERENCCDDIALELCNNRLVYAKALVAIEEQNQVKVPGMALAFSNGKKQTLNRIRRILNHPQNKSKIMEKFAITSLLLLTILVVSMSEYNAADFISEEALHSDSEIITIESSIEPLRSDATTFARETNHIQKVTVTVTDTLPKGKNRLIVEREDQKMEVEIEDGEIKAMKIDGKEIPKEEFEQHVVEVEELWGTEPENESGMFWVSPSEDNIFKFHSGEDGNVEFFFDSEDGVHLLSPDIQLKMDGLFLDSDGESIFVFPDSKNFDFDFEFSEDAIDEYKDQMKELQLQLKENGHLNELKLKELKEHQLQLAEKYKHQARERADRHRDEKIIIREKQHLGRLKWVEEKEARSHALRKLKEEQSRLRLNNDFLHSDANVFILGGHGHSNNKSDRLIRKMHEDGLIDSADDYKVELSDKHLKINGKKQTKTLHQKYRQLYETLSGFEMSKKSKIIIENN